jgi:hypothetical protein
MSGVFFLFLLINFYSTNGQSSGLHYLKQFVSNDNKITREFVEMYLLPEIADENCVFVCNSDSNKYILKL